MWCRVRWVNSFSKMYTISPITARWSFLGVSVRGGYLSSVSFLKVVSS